MNDNDLVRTVREAHLALSDAYHKEIAPRMRAFYRAVDAAEEAGLKVEPSYYDKEEQPTISRKLIY